MGSTGKVTCVALAVLFAGCQSNKTRVVEGALAGAAVGAAAGGIIGHQHHYGSEGAGIGAAIGVLTGAIVGSQINKEGQPQAQAPAPSQAANPNQITVQQIIDYSKQGVNEDVIIDKVRLTNSTYSAMDIDILRQNGVKQKVLDALPH